MKQNQKQLRQDQKRRRIVRVALSLGLMAAGFALLFVVLTAAMRWYYRLDRYIGAVGEEQLLHFSLEQPLVDSFSPTLALELPERLAEHVDIHYTVNSTEPTAQSPVYGGPIQLEAPESRGCWTVKVLVCQGETQSPVYTRTYFPKESAATHPNQVMVVLTGNEDDFYHPETGILMRGAETAETAFEDEDLPLGVLEDERANWFGRGQSWERPVTVEVYDAEGNQLAHQKAGVRVVGVLSRYMPQKSLRLYARRSYDEAHPSFPAELLAPDVSCEGSETPITKYNHMDLRNGGTDAQASMLADPSMRMLAKEAGMAPVGNLRPAVVYLNGRYYGVAWLQPACNRTNIARMCALEDSEKIEILDNAEDDAVMDREAPSAADADYRAFYKLATADLTMPANAAKLEEVLDIDNFLLYYALEVWSNNMDWPGNNYRVWRYTGATDEEKAQNPYADGRWRYYFYDLDTAFGTYVDSPDGFTWTLDDENSPVLMSFLQNENYRARFVNVLCHLAATTLQPQHVEEVIYSLKDQIEGELLYREAQDPGEQFYGNEYRQKMYLKIDDFLARRPGEVTQNLRERFGMESPYTLKITPPQTGATVYVDRFALTPGAAYSATYYKQAPLTLRCTAGPGWRHTGWLVNGQPQTGAELVLQPNEATGEVAAEPILEPIEDAAPAIYAVSYRNQRNYVELYAPGATPQPAGGIRLWLGTAEDEGHPVYTLPAGATLSDTPLRIYQQDNDFAPEDVGSHQMDADMRRDGVLRLYAASGELLSEVTLPAKRVGFLYAQNPNAPGWHWVPLAPFAPGEGAGDAAGESTGEATSKGGGANG